MKENKIRVFLTGATGVMCGAGLKELMKYPEKYEVTVLARNSNRNLKKLKDCEAKGVNIIWGDLLDKNAIQQGVENADIVLHVGGMVSPQADFYPEKTLKVNVGSMTLIAESVKEIEKREPQRIIKLVYIGSVSQYGSKLPPDHWGNVNLPQQAAKMDAYAESKIKAEKVLREAGLKRWVSLRQTAILHSGLLKNINNPVIFHTPLLGVLEWISVEDSGRLLERVCRCEIPDDFWNKSYNVGGGESFRLTNLEFERGIMKTVGCPPPEKIFEPNWFAVKNFHGMWFEDSDELDRILHFRQKDSFEEALERLKKELPFYYKAAPLAPAFLIKRFMKGIASKSGLGPLYWVKTNDEKRIEAAWGSMEEYRKIPGWDGIKIDELSRKSPDKEKNR